MNDGTAQARVTGWAARDALDDLSQLDRRQLVRVSLRYRAVQARRALLPAEEARRQLVEAVLRDRDRGRR